MMLRLNMRRNGMTTRVWGRGVTLPEMLVAVSITVAMLLMTGMIFKSATDASGKAMAHNEIMEQLRVVTEQLDRDFAGLRPDMPMAVIFQWGVDVDGTIYDVRQDRITFFTNGDFQTLDGTVSGNVARVFYGQSQNWYPSPADDEWPDVAPRFVLTRRQKVLTAAWGAPWTTGANWVSLGYVAGSFDSASWENTCVPFWQNQPFEDYEQYYFNDDYADNDATASMVRRPNVVDVASFGLEGVQGVYMLPDVSEFKIEVWFGNSFYPNMWMPREIDWAIDTDSDGLFAFYWNTETVGLTDWYCEDIAPAVTLPQALRFTFTLHDRGRRHYPEGLTFSYIVRLPERQ